MNLLKKLIIFLFLVGFNAPSYAAVDDVELPACGVYSDSEDKGKEGEEEEPDCD